MPTTCQSIANPVPVDFQSISNAVPIQNQSEVNPRTMGNPFAHCNQSCVYLMSIQGNWGPIQCQLWFIPSLSHQNTDPIPIRCQSGTHLPILHQSTNIMPIEDQSINLPTHHQSKNMTYGANHWPFHQHTTKPLTFTTLNLSQGINRWKLALDWHKACQWWANPVYNPPFS